jgi:hypothetical protein
MNFQTRLRAKGDLFAGVLSDEIDMLDAITRLENQKL